MAELTGEVKVKLVFTNRKAMRALRVVAEVLDELKEDLPWRDDVRRAVKAAKYAFKHFEVRPGG